MKKLSLLLIVLSLWSIKSVSQEKYTSELGKYSIEYLGEIAESTRETDKTTSYKITFNSASLNYLVMATKHISNLEDSIDELLDISINTFNKKVNGIISNQKEVTLGDVKGKYALINLQDNKVKIELYAYMNNNYQYQLVAYAEDNNYDQKEVNSVFNSFEIIE